MTIAVRKAKSREHDDAAAAEKVPAGHPINQHTMRAALARHDEDEHTESESESERPNNSPKHAPRLDWLVSALYVPAGHAAASTSVASKQEAIDDDTRPVMLVGLLPSGQ